MYILMIGLKNKTISAVTQKRFVFQEKTKGEVIKTLKTSERILEVVILETCNRIEIYAVVDQLNPGIHYLQCFFSDWFGVGKRKFIDSIYIKENGEAVEHLFRVACNRNSNILGETQILEKIKDSFFQSKKYKCTGVIFNMLFKQAIALAKRVQSNTDIGINANSVSYSP